jgi:tight adherence protein C
MHLSIETIFIMGLFSTMGLLAYALSGLVFRKEINPIVKRLKNTPPADEPAPKPAGHSLYPVVNKLSNAAGQVFMPKDPKNQSFFKQQLLRAGYYSPTAMQTIIGAKVIGLFAGAVLGWLLGSFIGGLASAMLMMMLALAGYLLPSMYLRTRIAKRMRGFESALPDALDLLVVCVEAGLTLDAAIQRVGHEISMAHPDIGRELGITHMETRIGVNRTQALRNLGQRTGSAALQSLAAMLVQTERFGTSIAQALRVHADSLRTKRQHAAEERAAKTTVKLAFPVVLFIFPTLIVVLGGPAFILFFKSPLFFHQP